MKFNVICGLPRSGSTLLCNLLNQNPDIYAGSTSPLCQTLATISHSLSSASEFQSALIANREEAEATIHNSMKAFAEQWYTPQGKPIIFDKGRGWALNSQMLHALFPDALTLVTVRDPREVFASMEKQHAKNPLLNAAQTGQEKTVFARADTALSPTGIVGSCILGVEDLLRRKPERTLFVDYRALCENPAGVLDRIYLKLGLPTYEGHDLVNIQNTAQDVDGLYLYKFPHDGSGKVQDPPSKIAWREYVSEDLGSLIISRYPYYCKAFDYGQGG